MKFLMSSDQNWFCNATWQISLQLFQGDPEAKQFTVEMVPLLALHIQS